MKVEEKIKQGQHKLNHLILPGFRPYLPVERQHFFGREKEAAIIREKIFNNRFYAVVGEPGVGKSSLINCRLLPALQQDTFPDKVFVLKFDTLVRPFNQLSRVLLEFIKENQRDVSMLSEEDIHTVLYGSSTGFAEILEKIIRPDERMVFVFDHFEEIFYADDRHTAYELQKERQKFINAVMEIVNLPAPKVNILVVVGSDYLGDIYEVSQFGELVNQHSYLLNKMNTMQLREVVSGICRTGNLVINDFEINHLISQLESNKYILSSLQYAFRHFSGGVKSSKRANAATYIQIEDELGTLLSLDLNARYQSLGPKKRTICQKLFQNLFIASSKGRYFRKPVSVGSLSRIIDVPPSAIIEILQLFQGIQTDIFLYSGDDLLNEDTEIMLVHELIFILWDRYPGWIEEEVASKQTYTKLSKSSELYQQGKTGLLTGVELALMLEWREKTNPAIEWALGINPAFNRAMIYLTLSEKTSLEEAEGKKQKTVRVRHLKKYLIIGGIAFSLIIVLLILVLPSGEITPAETPQEASPAYALSPEHRSSLLQERSTPREQVPPGETGPEAEPPGRDRTVPDELRDIRTPAARLAEQQTRRTQSLPVTAQPTQTSGRSTVSSNEVAEDPVTRTEITGDGIQGTPVDMSAENVALRREGMLNLSASLASESLTISEPELKKLLAYQAYLFNRRYGDQGFNPVIHAGLYNALVSAKIDINRYFRGHGKSINKLAVKTGTRMFFSAGNDGRVIEWDHGSGTVKSRTVLDASSIYELVAVSNDGFWLAAATFEGNVHLLNLKSGNQRIIRLDGHQGKVKSLVFMPDNNFIVSTGTDRKVFLWNLVSGGSVELDNPYGIILDAAISPNGRYIAGCSRDGRILLWDRESLDAPAVLFQDVKSSFYSVEFSRRGTYLVAGDLNGNVMIWDFPSRRMTENIKTHAARVLDITFSPDGKLMATSSMDGTIAVWKVNQWNQTRVMFTDNKGFVFSIFFSTDSRELFSCDSESSEIIVRSLSSDVLADRFCSILTRNLTRAEWNRYIGAEAEYEPTCPGL